jgi:L-aminopeptidase/D-esterase-like protein
VERQVIPASPDETISPEVGHLWSSNVGDITEVCGIRIGHSTRRTRGWRTGTTVVYAPGGAVAGVDVRGGGPGTRETEALSPLTLVERVNAVCLSGGSAYGLAAADGVMALLEQRGLGVRVGPEECEVVPVVPAAVIFDLGRGGRFSSRPDREFGERALRSASSTRSRRGAVGAGTGARAGGLQGGVGSASCRIGGITVGALAVVNAAGQVVNPATGLPWMPEGFDLARPTRSEISALRNYFTGMESLRAAGTGDAGTGVAGTRSTVEASLNTTIGVIATDAELTVAEATKLASVGHDGMARAIRPVHSMFDGDTVFTLATGEHRQTEPGVEDALYGAADSRPGWLNMILAAGAECFSRACTDAILSAVSHPERPGQPAGPLAYRDLLASAFRTRGSRR